MEKLILIDTNDRYKNYTIRSFEYESKEQFTKDLFEAWRKVCDLSEQYWQTERSLKNEFLVKHGLKTFFDLLYFQFKGIDFKIKNAFITVPFKAKPTLENSSVKGLFTYDELYNKHHIELE